MSYTANVPVSGQTLGNSRPIINANFGAINTAFSVNHVAFNSADQGKHKFCTFLTQGTSSASSPGTAANDVNFYSRSQTGFDGSAPNLYLQFGPNGAGAADVLMTRRIAPVTASNGYTFLPGGLILQWGFLQGAPFIANNAAVTFPLTFPSAIYNIQMTGVTASTDDKTINVKNGSQTTSGFNVICSGSSQFTFINWVAIGL